MRELNELIKNMPRKRYLLSALIGVFFVLGTSALFGYITLSGLKNEAFRGAELAALPVNAYNFESGFITPASCGVVTCGKGGCRTTDFGHPEWGGACAPPPPSSPPPPAPPPPSSPPPPPPKPTASISASPSSIPYNTASTITWSSTNASACSVSPTGWTGTSGSQSTGNLTSSQTYNLNCSGPGGSAADSATVNVFGQILTFQASPTIINKGQSSTLNWTTSGFSSCSLTGNPPPPASVSVPVNGSYGVTPGSTTIYTLTCNPGSVSRSAQVSVTSLIEILPP